jgi:hypothetical protein
MVMNNVLADLITPAKDMRKKPATAVVIVPVDITRINVSSATARLSVE